MKALIWKECHENLKWAVLAMLVAGGLMFLNLKERTPDTIMSAGFVAVTILISAVFAAVLGFLQVFTESGGDRRSLLLHRPVSRSHIFLAKAAAGLGLYLLALGIPFACAAAWSAAPGHVPAPFRWPMVLPGLADILAGVVYYFAGMLTAQREARWYGSRGLGRAAAVLCSLMVFSLPEFRHALAVIGAFSALLAVAAWGSFISGGEYLPQPRLAKAALAGTFLTGLLLVGTTLQLVLGSWFESRALSHYELDRQGRLLIVKSVAGDMSMSVSDLGGEEPPEFKGRPLDHHALLEIKAPLSSLGHGPEFHWYRHHDRLFLPVPGSSAHGDRWYYVFDEARLVGFDKQSKRVIGSMGPDGFVPVGQEPRERFQGTLYYRQGYFVAMMAGADFLPFSDGVYTLNFAERTVHPLIAPAHGQIILDAQRKVNEKDKEKPPLTFVLTESAIRVVDDAGAPLFSTSLAHDPKDYQANAGWLDNPRRFVVWYRPVQPWLAQPAGAGRFTILLLSNFAFQYLPSVWSQEARGPSYLVEYDAGGSVLKRRTVPPLPVPEPAPAQGLYGLFTPLAGVLLYGGAFQHYFTTDDVWSAGMGSGFLPVFTVLMLLSALACALVCLLLARRHAFSRARRLGWALCGFLWGPAGLLLMLALQEWPARTVCPGCRKPRVATRDRCEHCGAAHATPTADGTEVFEPSAVTPHAALARH